MRDARPSKHLPCGVLVIAAAGCIQSAPAVWAPSAMVQAPKTEGCARAHAFVARGPKLVAEGRLDRAARALTRAEELCPAEAPATWAQRVRALADLGRTTEAFQLAARIERSDRAGDVERAAAKAAREVAEARAQQTTERGNRRDAPELFDPSETKRVAASTLFHRAAAASHAGDHASAKQLFLDAWQASHPDPRALVEAGREAALQGKPAEAQALWDRAAFDDSTLAATPVMVTGAPSAVGSRVMAWAAHADMVAISGDHVVEVFDLELHPILRVVPKETVTALGFAADGARLYVGLESGAVQVFDALTGLALKDLAWHHAAVRAIAASPDGSLLATASEDGGVGLWDAPKGAWIVTHAARRTGPRHAAVAVAFDAQSEHLAVADEEGQIDTYRAHAATFGGTLRSHGPVLAMSFGALKPEGARLEVVTPTERVGWELRPSSPARPTTLARMHTQRASLASAGDGAPKPIVATDDGTTLAVGDLLAKDATLAMPSTDHGGITSFAVAPSGGDVVAVFKDRAIVLLAVGVGHAPRWLAPSGPIQALATAQDAASGMVAVTLDGRVMVWRTAGERLHAYDVAGAGALALSPDGSTLAMGLENHHVELRDLRTSRPDVFFDASASPVRLVFSADGSRLAVATDAPSLMIFDRSSPQAVRSFALGGAAHAVRFSPDGSSLAVASKEGLTLFPTGTVAAPSASALPPTGFRATSYGPDVRDVAFTPDGTALVVGSQRGELLLGKIARAPTPAAPVVVSARVIALAVSKDGAIATLEGDRGVALRSPAGKTGHRFRDGSSALRFVSFLGAHAAAGLDDGSVHVYRAPDPGPSAILELVSGLGPGKLAGVARGLRGQLELVGPDAAAARGSVRCLVGAVFYPLDVCAEQFVVDGLLPMVLAGKDPAEAEP